MLLRFDPFRELDREFDRLVPNVRRPATMPLDAWRQGDRFFATIDLPGVDPGSIDLTVEKNVLNVTAERRWEKAEGDEVLIAERPHGRFTRQLFLGEGLDAEGIEARYEHGVLTIVLPVAEASKPRKVAIATGAEGASDVRAIDAA